MPEQLEPRPLSRLLDQSAELAVEQEGEGPHLVLGRGRCASHPRVDVTCAQLLLIRAHPCGTPHGRMSQGHSGLRLLGGTEGFLQLHDALLVGKLQSSCCLLSVLYLAALGAETGSFGRIEILR